MAKKEKFINIPVDDEMKNFFDGIAEREDTSLAHICRSALRDFKRRIEESQPSLLAGVSGAQPLSRGDNEVVVPSRCLGTRKSPNSKR